MEINQVLVSVSPGDAVTTAALRFRDLLRRVGPSNIYALHIAEALRDDVLSIDRYLSRPNAEPFRDVLVFHASIGDPGLFAFLERQPDRLVLMYHNISPPDLFASFNPAFAALLEEGRRELTVLRDRVELALAVSEYNAEDLRALGYDNVHVSPLVIDVEPLQSEPDDAVMAAELDRGSGPLILTVGQLLPHKRPDLVLKAYHVLVTHLVPEARLLMIGPARLPGYLRALRLFAEELGLVNARFTGAVSGSSLATAFRRASAFVTASEHEGVCVPLIEAMAFDVPVIARAHAAIPETLGHGGLLLPGDDDPVLLAEAMAEVITNATTRTNLIAAGRERRADFTPERSREAFLRHLLAVA